MGELLRGKVTAYPDETDKGFVEVAVGVYDQEGDTIYARAETGLEGVYWLPEIGAVVDVEAPDLPGGEARVRYVHRPADDGQLEACWTEKNDIKQFKTRSGHTITLDDTEDAACITILTAGGLQLRLDDSTKQVSVKAKDADTPCLVLDTDSDKDAVTVSAGKSLSLQCGGASLEIDSSGNITISTNGKLNMSAQEITLDAQMNLTAKAGQQAQLSGSMSAKVSGETQLDLTSGGVTQVKGSMLKLN